MSNNIILPPQGTNGTTNPIAETLDTTGSSGPQRQFISLRSGTAGDNADVIGPTNDTADTSDTATASINARLQRVAQNLTTVKNTIGAPFQAGASVGNTSFGISGTLPAFASTPTVNVGTEPCTGSTGAAVPSTAQYAGMSVAGNLTGLTGTANGLKVDGSSVTQPVSIASMPSTPVTGTFFQSTQPVSATSLPLPAGAATSASQPAINGDGGALAHVTNFPATQPVSIASMPSTPVTGTFWQATQPVSAASLPLPTGAAASANQPTNAAIGSTTSGQTGLLEMGAVTTASPSYTTGQTAPISLDTSGNLRVNVVAGGGAGGTSSTFGSAFPGTGTAAGGEYLSSPPTLTSGQMVALQTDVNGNLKVNVSAGGAAGGTSSNFSATFPAGTRISAASFPRTRSRSARTRVW